MTIQFVGHVRRLDTNSAPPGKMAVTLCTPTADANGAEWVIFVPATEAAHWLPGRMVNFTIYTLPEPTGAQPSQGVK